MGIYIGDIETCMVLYSVWLKRTMINKQKSLNCQTAKQRNIWTFLSLFLQSLVSCIEQPNDHP